MEHRLFFSIRLNWKGKPLVSHETVVNLIGGTKTKTGLTVQDILVRYEQLGNRDGSHTIGNGTD
jgi:hypothetical protein